MKPKNTEAAPQRTYDYRSDSAALIRPNNTAARDAQYRNAGKCARASRRGFLVDGHMTIAQAAAISVQKETRHVPMVK